MYFPQHLGSPVDFISIWFVFRAGEKESWIWQALLLKPTPAGATLLVQSLRPVTLAAPGNPQFQSFPHPTREFGFFCKRLWLFQALSLTLLSQSILCRVGTWWSFSPLSSSRCFWFSGCTPVKLGHWGALFTAKKNVFFTCTCLKWSFCSLDSTARSANRGVFRDRKTKC